MRNATLTCDFSRDLGSLDMSRMALGQGGLSPDTMWESRIPEIRSLRPKLIRFWIQEYFNIMPAAGVYRFEQIDRSIDMILQTGATPLVSINCKPKLLFPTIDDRNMTPTSRLAWEELIYQLVKHYVDRGQRGFYWEIGGETDQGEGGGCPYLATAETYIPFYEHTARAILRADPSARVGGAGFCHLDQPFMAQWLDWCTTAPVPVHFVSWHGYTNNPLDLRNSITHVRALLAARPTLKCETILDEWNMSLNYLSGHTADPRFQPCFIAETIWHMLDAGLNLSCYYHIRDYHVDMNHFLPFFTPGGAAFMARWWNRMPQADGLFDYQNIPRPAFFAFKLLSRLTGQRLFAESSDPLIHAFLVHDPIFRMTNLMFWNFSPEPANLQMSLLNLRTDQNALRCLLDAQTPSSDENHRIRPLRTQLLTAGSQQLQQELTPFSIHFWALHGRSWDLGN